MGMGNSFGSAFAKAEIDAGAARAALRTAYESVCLIGLDATRKRSSEIYVIAFGYRGGRA